MEALKDVFVFWTGGWTSTFRLLQLSQEKGVCIHPVYCIDRDCPSRLHEMAVMQRILPKLRQKAKASILDIWSVDVDWIREHCANTAVREAWRVLKERYDIESQYEWLALLCAWRGIRAECCSARGDFVEKLVGTEGRFGKSRQQVELVFGNMTFPLLSLSTRDIQRCAVQQGWMDMLRQTWFCHTPVDGKPCGLCIPCTRAMRRGMRWRLPFAARIRYWKRFFVQNTAVGWSMARLKRGVRQLLRRAVLYALGADGHALTARRSCTAVVLLTGGGKCWNPGFTQRQDTALIWTIPGVLQKKSSGSNCMMLLP